MFCEYCGAKLNDQHNVCPHCGAPITKSTYDSQKNVKKSVFTIHNDGIHSQKSRIVTVVLAFVVGSLGVHNFYLGHKEKAIKQLLWATLGAVIVIGPMIAYFWSVYEAIVYCFNSDATDGEGKKLLTLIEEVEKLSRRINEKLVKK